LMMKAPTEKHLMPLERLIISKIVEMGEVTVKDIDHYSDGSIRNAFLSLKRKDRIKRSHRDRLAHYVLVTPSETGPMTANPMHVASKIFGEGGGIGEVEWVKGTLEDQAVMVHDVCLSFKSPSLYSALAGVIKDGSEAFELKPRSGDLVSIMPYPWVGGRSCTTVVRRTGRVDLYVKSSNAPLELSLEGLMDLAHFLGSVRGWLMEKANTGLKRFPADRPAIPPVGDWTVLLWHIGHDGDREYAGKAFSTTFRDWSGNFFRLYTKRKGGRLRLRLERIESPRKTLAQVLEERVAQPEQNAPTGLLWKGLHRARKILSGGL